MRIYYFSLIFILTRYDVEATVTVVKVIISGHGSYVPEIIIPDNMTFPIRDVFKTNFFIIFLFCIVSPMIMYAKVLFCLF